MPRKKQLTSGGEDEMLTRMAQHEAGHLIIGWLCDLVPDTCEINAADSTTGTWSGDREQEYPVIGILADLAGMMFDGELKRIQELEKNIDSPEHYSENDDESKIIERIQTFEGDHRKIFRGFCKVMLDIAAIFQPLHEETVKILLKYRKLNSLQCQKLYEHWTASVTLEKPERPHSDFFCRRLAEYIGKAVPANSYLDWDFKPLFMLPQDITDDIARKIKGMERKAGKGDKMQKKEKATTSKKTTSKVYWLRVTFDDYENVCADIEARDTTTYEQLHDVIFEAFNRWEEHLYMFTLPDGTQVLSPYDEIDEDSKPANKCKLGKTLSLGDTIDYLFDFGDCWEHTINVQGFIEADPNVKYPRLVKVHGDVPPQYPEDEDDEFEEDEQ